MDANITVNNNKKTNKSLNTHHGKVETFPIPFSIEKISEDISINSKEEIINKAISLHLNGNILDAEKYYRYFCEQGFSDPRVFCNFGTILMNSGAFKEAELYTRMAIKLNPDYAIAFTNLGSILSKQGKLEEAEKSTLKAIKLNPNSSDSYLNYGCILYDQAKFNEAEKSIRTAIKLNPNSSDSYLNLGNILKSLGKLEDAREATFQAINIDPNNYLYHYNYGVILKELGKFKEAEDSTRKAIQLNSDFAEAFLNLGAIFKGNRNFKEAEIYTRKAILINPNYYEAHSNLGSILINIGKLKDAKVSILNALKINPFLAKAYFLLSMLKLEDISINCIDMLFCEDVLANQSYQNKVDIYFARANILHNQKKYYESAKYLELANKLKLLIKPSRANLLIKRSEELFFESIKDQKRNLQIDSPETIFIVGMPRSGSTLLESILAMNASVDDLGEINIFEESYQEWQDSDRKSTLAEIYWQKTANCKSDMNIKTNKWLYNYQYAGIISQQIPKAKIIHCFRNPLDNILSIYRTHFGVGNEYSSSLVDCVSIYLNHEKVMKQYKKLYRSNIYDLNYDLLVKQPNHEIKSLISWLGWDWDDLYLSPHLNTRSVLTASTVQVRSPINSKSVGGWKNYREMLLPAIEILKKNDFYLKQDLL